MDLKNPLLLSGEKGEGESEVMERQRDEEGRAMERQRDEEGRAVLLSFITSVFKCFNWVVLAIKSYLNLIRQS